MQSTQSPTGQTNESDQSEKKQSTEVNIIIGWRK